MDLPAIVRSQRRGQQRHGQRRRQGAFHSKGLKVNIDKVGSTVIRETKKMKVNVSHVGSSYGR